MIRVVVNFNPVVPVWWIAVIAVGLTAFLIRHELLRKYRFKILRVCAQMLVVLALTGVALRPAARSTVQRPGLMLLTLNYNPKIADSLRLKYPELKIMRTAKARDYASTEVIKDWRNLEKLEQQIKFVLGDGIPTAVLDAFPDADFQYFPSSAPTGVESVSMAPFYANRTNHVRGTVHSGTSAMHLLLEGPGGREDSLTIPAGQTQAYSLSFTPRQAGLFAYSLVTKDAQVKKSENLPLEILPEQKLNILIIQQYPTAEIRYLKNFLADHQQNVVLRFRVSKNQYRYEYANHDRNKVDLLTAELLHDFDLIIIDNETLDQLQMAETKRLFKAVEDGFGLVITGGKSPRGFNRVVYGKQPADTATVSLASGEKLILPLIPSVVPADFEILPPYTKTTPASGFVYLGKGRIGYLLLQDTWSLVLRGQTSAYTSIWTLLIEEVAKRKVRDFKIRIGDFPRFTNHPIAVEVISQSRRPDLFSDNDPVAAAEDETVDGIWRARLWTSPASWHTITIPSDSMRMRYYVSGEQEWSAVALTRQQLQNTGRGHKPEKITAETEEIFIEISPLVFFIAFLMASGFLWLVPKLKG